MAGEIRSAVVLKQELLALAAQGALDPSRLDGLRARVAVGAGLDTAIADLLAGRSVQGVQLTAAERQRLHLTQGPTATPPGVAGLNQPGTFTSVSTQSGDRVTELRAARQVWRIGDLPMAGPLGYLVPTLWASGGPLDKVDQVLAKRGQSTGALAHEQRSALNELVGKEAGGYVPSLWVREWDAQGTTGVDFVRALLPKNDPHRALPLAADVRLSVDFLDAEGVLSFPKDPGERWVAVARGTRTPLRVTSEVSKSWLGRESMRPVFLDVKGKRVPPWQVVVVAKKADGSIKGDGKATGHLITTWWGSCDAVAVAGRYFDKPRHPVTVDGVTFSTHDIMALLAMTVDTDEGVRFLAGAQYGDGPDVVLLQQGSVTGTVENLSTAEMLAGESKRREGMIERWGATARPLRVTQLDGTTLTIDPKRVVAVLREDERDVEPAAFHRLLEEQLGRGEPLTLDVDSGPEMKNLTFDGATLTESRKKPLLADVRDLPGHNGPYRGGALSWVTAELKRGNEVIQTYRYWLERDAKGAVVNSGWAGAWFSSTFIDSPDFVWAPEGKPELKGPSPRNPHVPRELIGEIYRRSLAP